MPSLTLRALLALLLPVAIAAAQDPDAKVRHPDNRLYTLGHDVKALAGTLDAIETSVNDMPNRYRKLELAAWRALALDANGANMRYGPRKAAFKRLVAWLRMGTLPDHNPKTLDEDTPRELHLLAVFVVARAQIESNYKLLLKSVEGGWVDVRRKFLTEGAAPVTVREAALLVMFAHTVQRSKWPRFQTEATKLASEAIEKIPRGRDKLADAVRHQLERRAGTDHPAALTLATCWPGDVVRDPLHAFFAAFVTRMLPPKARAQQWQVVEPWISVRAKDGIWDVPGDQDRDITAAMVLATIGMCHEPEGFEPSTHKDELRESR